MNKKSVNLKKSALFSALMMELVTVAQAATIDVDGTTCTLNDAVIAANTDAAVGGCVAGSGDDIIELPNGATLQLTGTLDIQNSVTINGNGTIITGPEPPTFQLMSISNGFVNINEVTLQNGYDASVGGISVTNTGNLTLEKSIVKDIIGGGVSFQGWGGTLNEVTVENTGNSTGNYFGAAISVVGTTAGVLNSTIVGNNNQSNLSGGAIWTSDYTSSLGFFISNSTISGNSSANRGGGLSHSDYNNHAAITISNSTIVNNSSDGDGGGLSLENADRVTILSSLISENMAGGLGDQIHVDTADLSLDNYNIIGEMGTAGIEGATVGATDIIPIGMVFGEVVAQDLANNGGLTKTHALIPGSVAIDAVPNGSCATNQDQTGKTRPIDGDGNGIADCDVGAFEYTDVIFADGFEGL